MAPAAAGSVFKSIELTMTQQILIIALLLVVAYALWRLLERETPPKFSGMSGAWYYERECLTKGKQYSMPKVTRPNWIKFQLKKAVFNVFFRLQELLHSQRRDPAQWDKSYPLEPWNSPYALDSYFFCTHDKDGTWSLLRLCPRVNKRSEIWLTLRIPGLGLLEPLIAPFTYIRRPFDAVEPVTGAGLTFKCVEPGKLWEITYKGKMRLRTNDDYGKAADAKDTFGRPEPRRKSDEKIVNVSFKLMSTSDSPLFDFSGIEDPKTRVESVAREEWTSDYFQFLKYAHQTHIEVFQHLDGNVNVDGKDWLFHGRGLRDRSTGRARDWQALQRYVIHYWCMEDGRAFQVGLVCMPLLSKVQIGWATTPEGQMYALQDTTTEFTDLITPTHLPTRYGFNFKFNNEWHTADVEIMQDGNLYDHDSGFVNDRPARFRMDGKEMPGYGFAEFCVRRPEFEDYDPMIMVTATENYHNKPYPADKEARAQFDY